MVEKKQVYIEGLVNGETYTFPLCKDECLEFGIRNFRDIKVADKLPEKEINDFYSLISKGLERANPIFNDVFYNHPHLFVAYLAVHHPLLVGVYCRAVKHPTDPANYMTIYDNTLKNILTEKFNKKPFYLFNINSQGKILIRPSISNKEALELIKLILNDMASNERLRMHKDTINSLMEINNKIMNRWSEVLDEYRSLEDSLDPAKRPLLEKLEKQLYKTERFF